MKKLIIGLLPIIIVMALILSACSPYEITYDFDLNYEGAPEIESITFTNVERPDLPKNPEREGYLFNGWTYGSGSTLSEDDILYVNVTFKAQWLELFTVTFNSYAVGVVSPPPQEVADGMLATAPSNLINEGLGLEGWYTDLALIEKFDFNTPITADINLFAKWVEIYDVTFNYNYEDAPAATVIEYMAGSDNILPAPPVRADYTFTGWHPTSAGDGIMLNSDYIVTSDITYYAKWISNT